MLISIHRKTIVTVRNHKDLRQMWRQYGPREQLLIGRVVSETPLTESQISRLPNDLRAVFRQE